MTYYGELMQAMEQIAYKSNSIFLGQAVAFPGTGMTSSFARVPRTKLLELPVFEETQLGMSIGLALDGWLPVSVFPRWNFLVCAANQLVNHLDKLPKFAGVSARVIIRVATATSIPLDPGPQHLGDLSDAFREMLTTVRIVNLVDARRIVREYEDAAVRRGSTILVEYPALYDREIEHETAVRSPDRVLPVGR